MNTRFECKDTRLISVLKEHLKGEINLARVKYICLFIFALCKVKIINYDRLASGFEVTDLKRLERLFLLSIIAFVWCYKIGDYIDQEIKEIVIKKHRRKAISVFKYGLDYLSRFLITGFNTLGINIFKFLSCT